MNCQIDCMNRIQFFYDNDLVALELKINKWLSANKEKRIIQTNLNSLGTPGIRAGVTNTEKYVFYILYSTIMKESMLTEKKAEEILPQTRQLEAKYGEDTPNN